MFGSFCWWQCWCYPTAMCCWLELLIINIRLEYHCLIICSGPCLVSISLPALDMLACTAISWHHRLTYTHVGEGWRSGSSVCGRETNVSSTSEDSPPSNIVETWNFGMANKVYPPPPTSPLDMSGVGHARRREGEGGRDGRDDRSGSLLEVTMFLIMISLTPPDTFSVLSALSPLQALCYQIIVLLCGTVC